MADDDQPSGGRPKLDAADLKARLGLKRRKNKPSDASQPASGGGDAASRAAQPVPVATEMSIAEARRRAEAAMEAERADRPAAEEFGLSGHDRTPLPQRLDPVVRGSERFEGQGRGKIVPFVIGLVVAVGASFFLGRLLGAGGADSAVIKSQQAEAKERLDRFAKGQTTHKTAIKADIDAFTDELDALVSEIEQVEAAIDKSGKADFLSLEKPLIAFIPTLKSFVDGQTYWDAVAMFKGPTHPKVGEAARNLALTAQSLWDRASVALGEAEAYVRETKDGPQLDNMLAQSRGPVKRGVFIAVEPKPTLSAWACEADKDCPTGKGCLARAKCASDDDCQGNIAVDPKATATAECTDGKCAVGLECTKRGEDKVDKCYPASTPWCVMAEGKPEGACSHSVCEPVVPRGTAGWVGRTQLLWPKGTQAPPDATGKPGGITYDWQYAVLPLGTTKRDAVVRVATGQVAELDISDVYDQQAEIVRVLAVNRLVTVIKDLAETAQKIDFGRFKTVVEEFVGVSAPPES